MTWRKTVNTTLRQLTGYELRRIQSRPAAALPTAVPAPAAPAVPKPLKFPADYDETAKEIITAVKPWTMTSLERLNALIQSVRYVTRHDLPGDIVECGVWRGGSMQAVARTLLSLDVKDRELYLFDTFEGMSEPTDEDKRVDGRSAADLLATQGKDRPIWALATLDDVQDGFSRIDYPSERLHYVQGKVEDTIPDQAPEKIAILRLDTDWYASTKHELEHLYDRLVPGGVLLLDDYGYWQGSRQAVDEFLEETGARLLLTRMDEGRIAVKP
ncbi:TylF/MycF/NovP-related O-methyltransferase [Streptacidiphilus melanogenes]|uniref:TylF/MycF/NovP-related O-methyltransferase n=1 Tax=Streptacidiphilus melanogenes TaxID=411235 RepID=UPI0005A86034|nr:TylF/MycF/NovP-related O-methyltransferase [Streptacidiphilus melanogenes]